MWVVIIIAKKSWNGEFFGIFLTFRNMFRFKNKKGGGLITPPFLEPGPMAYNFDNCGAASGTDLNPMQKRWHDPKTFPVRVLEGTMRLARKGTNLPRGKDI